jgi:hypothetical protein
MSCKFDSDDPDGGYKGQSCRYLEKNRKRDEEIEVPTCLRCCQKGGVLRHYYKDNRETVVLEEESQSDGLKIRCSDDCCSRQRNSEQSFYHATCARQAGLEVNVSGDYDLIFYRESIS